jgi:hypothetical protein
MGTGGGSGIQAAEGLADRIGELAANIHAATAELARLAADFDTAEQWAGNGIRSCAHWLSINTGFDTWTAAELLRIGHALRELPQIAEAFAAGRLSFDKVRAVTSVAAAADDQMWLEVAINASGSQLARICRAFRRAVEADSAELAEDRLSRRGLQTWWREDGMLQLTAALPPEDGAIVLAAIDGALAPPPRRNAEGEIEAAMADPALDSWGARRADALVSVCEQSLGDAANAAAPRRQLVVHVDVGVLTGDAAEGRCHAENGPALSAAVARRLGCDSEIVAITERDGLPVDVGRRRRIVPPRMRLALQARDEICRFPGCNVPAHRAEGHHLRHWIDGGPTNLANLLTLCGFHHRRLHDGAYRIRVESGEEPRFETADGQPLWPVTPRSVDPHAGGAATLRAAQDEAGKVVAPDTPAAEAGGAPCDFDYVIDVLARASQDAKTRWGPSP